MADLRDDVATAGAIAIAQSTVMTALLRVLIDRKVLTQEVVDEALDCALTGAENAKGDPALGKLIRKQIDEMAQTVSAAGPKRR